MLSARIVLAATLLATTAHAQGFVENFQLVTGDSATRSRRWVSYSPSTANIWSPIVVMMHGGGGNGNMMSGWTPARNGDMRPFLQADGDPLGWNRKAYDYGFHVLYPDATDDANGLDDGAADHEGNWNDGRGAACEDQVFAFRRNVDDVGFISSIIKKFMADRKTSRVFIAGVSNGGMMALRIASERNTAKLAGIPLLAIGTDVANLPLPMSASFPPAGKLSAILLFGHEDPRMAFQGGELERCGRVISADATVAKLHTVFAARSSWVRNPNPCDASWMEVTEWKNPDGTQVKMQTIHGMGHQYPPVCPPLAGLRGSGPMTSEFNATDEIWQFFMAR